MTLGKALHRAENLKKALSVLTDVRCRHALKLHVKGRAVGASQQLQDHDRTRQVLPDDQLCKMADPVRIAKPAVNAGAVHGTNSITEGDLL